MNQLDAVLTAVEPPVWDEKYNTWRVAVTYNCWSRLGTTEIWCREKADADKVKIGDTIQV